jgi:hypothetical protein
MKMEHCPNCQKITGHKRRLGMGTFIGGLFTAGLSLFAIPWYPTRCIVCGLPSGLDAEQTAELDRAKALSRSLALKKFSILFGSAWLASILYIFLSGKTLGPFLSICIGITVGAILWKRYIR